MTRRAAKPVAVDSSGQCHQGNYRLLTLSQSVRRMLLHSKYRSYGYRGACGNCLVFRGMYVFIYPEGRKREEGRDRYF